MKFDYLREQIDKQKQQSLLRKRVVVEYQSAREVVVDGRSYLNFSSNDYLGLNDHKQIVNAFEEGAKRFGTSASASSLVSGYQYAHRYLEDKICSWLNKPKCLLFNSGFSANQAVLNTLANKNTSIFLDKLSHASLIDGAFSSDAKAKRFNHNDYLQLSQLIDKNMSEHTFIVSEGVFSMDGDGADVSALATIAKQKNACLYLDDAHSVGVKGDNGQGSLGINNEIDIVMATCGKALATSGAFVVCDEVVHEYLLNFARHYIYSTAMSPANAWATAKSIEIIEKESWRRDKINHLSQVFSSTLDQHVKLLPTTSSIHAIVLGTEQQAIDAAKTLREHGIWLTAIRPPTVPKGTSRLRVTICSSHKESDIKHLAECINKVTQ